MVETGSDFKYNRLAIRSRAFEPRHPADQFFVSLSLTSPVLTEAGNRGRDGHGPRAEEALDNADLRADGGTGRSSHFAYDGVYQIVAGNGRVQRARLELRLLAEITKLDARAAGQAEQKVVESKPADLTRSRWASGRRPTRTARPASDLAATLAVSRWMFRDPLKAIDRSSRSRAIALSATRWALLRGVELHLLEVGEYVDRGDVACDSSFRSAARSARTGCYLDRRATSSTVKFLRASGLAWPDGRALVQIIATRGYATSAEPGPIQQLILDLDQLADEAGASSIEDWLAEPLPKRSRTDRNPSSSIANMCG